jgi:hypothetical protein
VFDKFAQSLRAKKEEIESPSDTFHNSFESDDEEEEETLSPMRKQDAWPNKKKKRLVQDDDFEDSPKQSIVSVCIHL